MSGSIKPKAAFLPNVKPKNGPIKWRLQSPRMQYQIRTLSLLNILETGIRPTKLQINRETPKLDTILFTKKISKEFGSTKLSKINRHSYQAFMNKYGKTHAKDTVYKTNGTIRTCVSDAVSDGIIHINFTNRINLIWNSERTRKIDYLNYKELQELKDSLLKKI